MENAFKNEWISMFRVILVLVVIVLSFVASTGAVFLNYNWIILKTSTNPHWKYVHNVTFPFTNRVFFHGINGLSPNQTWLCFSFCLCVLFHRLSIYHASLSPSHQISSIAVFINLFLILVLAIAPLRLFLFFTCNRSAPYFSPFYSMLFQFWWNIAKMFDEVIRVDPFPDLIPVQNIKRSYSVQNPQKSHANFELLTRNWLPLKLLLI